MSDQNIHPNTGSYLQEKMTFNKQASDFDNT